MTIVVWLGHCILIAGASYIIWKRQTLLRKFFWPALVVKLVAGVCLGLLYKHYYSASDTFVYFHDASILAALAREDLTSYLQVLALDRHVTDLPVTLLEPRALFFTKITSVVNLLTGDRYWITGLYYSCLSFFGAWYLVQTISRNNPTVRTAAVIAFLFLPSVVFWTSGIIKESVAMASIFFLTAFFLKVVYRERLRWAEYLLAAIALYLSWKLKYYYLAVLIPVVLTTFIYRFLVRKNFDASPTRQLVIWLLIFLIPLMLVTMLRPNFHLTRILDVMVSNNAAYNQLSHPSDVVHFDHLVATPFSILIHAPWALFSGLFRPLFWEGNSVMQVLAGIENTTMLMVFLAALFRLKKHLSSPQRVLVFALLVYVTVLAVFITISAPNFGTLSRYRVAYLPYFAFIILCDNPLLQYLERSFSRLVSE